MTEISELHREWSADPEYREAYERLAPEFALARTLIEARRDAGLTQAQLADRMETTQSVVARLESGRINPSTRTLEKVAIATGTRLRISFELTKNAGRLMAEEPAIALIERPAVPDE